MSIVIGILIGLILLSIILPSLIIYVMLSRKPITMICPNCGHKWTMSKRVYMTTPYIKRGVNSLFNCIHCGSEGKKSK